ncbi:hypothetical protein CHUAL_012476 [Chamberlinius hualienensis]
MNFNTKLSKFWTKKRSVTITEYDPTYKVVYLGNVLTAWAKGEGCSDKPLTTLWKNYCQNVRPDVQMKVTICNSGLKAVTKEHGLTEYWSHRITYWVAHPHYPKVFAWVYRHEGKKLRQELRCHAVLCAKEDIARRMANQLEDKLTLALQEFKREKICRQNARLSLANSVYANPSLPRRKILLSTGSANYRPPIQRSKSAPKLMAIEEADDDEDTFASYGDVDDVEDDPQNGYLNSLKSNRQQHRMRLFSETRRQLELDGADDEEDDDDDSQLPLPDPSQDILVNCELSIQRFEDILGTALLHMRDNNVDDDDDTNYNRNPRINTPDDDDDDICSSGTPCCSSSSTSSSPPSLRGSTSAANGDVRANGNRDEDNVSDESGYSEDNCSAQHLPSLPTEQETPTSPHC